MQIHIIVIKHVVNKKAPNAKFGFAVIKKKQCGIDSLRELSNQLFWRNR